MAAFNTTSADNGVNRPAEATSTLPQAHTLESWARALQRDSEALARLRDELMAQNEQLHAARANDEVAQLRHALRLAEQEADRLRNHVIHLTARIAALENAVPTKGRAR